MTNERDRSVRRPSPAMVVACIALFVALTGTSVAAVSVALPRGSVGTPQLKNGAVTSAKVRDRSLRAVDFARGQLPAGPAGPAGSKGDAGQAGPQGPPGISGYEMITAAEVMLATERTKSFQATCPSGKKFLGGGIATFNYRINILVSTPLDDGGRWVVTAGTVDNQPAGANSSVILRALCAVVN